MDRSQGGLPDPPDTSMCTSSQVGVSVGDHVAQLTKLSPDFYSGWFCHRVSTAFHLRTVGIIFMIHRPASLCCLSLYCQSLEHAEQRCCDFICHSSELCWLRQDHHEVPRQHEGTCQLVMSASEQQWLYIEDFTKRHMDTSR